MIQFFKDIYYGFKNAKPAKKVLYTSLVLLYLILIALVTIQVNVEAVTPGSISHSIATKEQENSNLSVYIDTANTPGEVYTVGVFSHKRISLFQYLIGKLNNDIEFEDYDPKTDLSKQEDQQIGKKSKDLSIINALIVAYTAAKLEDDSIKIEYDYEGVLVALVVDETKTDLRPDDVITHIDGEELTSIEHFRTLVSNKSYDKNFVFTILRNDKTMQINTLRYFDDASDSYVFGITIMDSYKINKEATFPSFEIHENYSSIGGSGGAMLTLGIYNSLNEGDITNGKRIIGTGTIALDGTVGVIGGVSQKIVTAKLYNADVFFCAAANYEEAKQKAEEINAEFEVVRVEKFSDILDYLKGEVNE